MTAHDVGTIVFSSSTAVYGEPEQIPIEETAALDPTNCYGETKRVMERMMCWTAAATGLRYAALRYFNACGAHPDGSLGEAHFPETHLIPLVLQVANGQRSEISVFGSDYPTPDGHLYPRLRPCVRSGAGAYSCARIPAARRRKHRLQPRQRTGVFRTRGDRGGAPRYRSCNPCRGKGAPQRRPGSARCVLGEGASTLGCGRATGALSTILQTAWNWHRSPSEGILRNCRKKLHFCAR